MQRKVKSVINSMVMIPVYDMFHMVLISERNVSQGLLIATKLMRPFLLRPFYSRFLMLFLIKCFVCSFWFWWKLKIYRTWKPKSTKRFWRHKTIWFHLSTKLDWEREPRVHPQILIWIIVTLMLFNQSMRGGKRFLFLFSFTSLSLLFLSVKPLYGKEKDF